MASSLERNRQVRVLSRTFALGCTAFAFYFLINNYLNTWQDWPGALNFLKHQQWLGLEALNRPLPEEQVSLGWIQLFALILLAALVIFGAVRTQNAPLRNEAELLSGLAEYLCRACFWAVMLVGLVDMSISFLRVEGGLEVLIGEETAKNLGRAIFRGTYVHYPLVLAGFVIAFFTRGLGFTWLALAVVFAEFQIVISRFVFSYEQSFMGDLVRMWYAGLFLFASAYALISEGHVRVDVFYTTFSARKKALSNAIGTVLFGLPLCWVILTIGMWDKGSSINSPLRSFEVSQQGFGMYIKYLMVAYLAVFALTMLIQFCSYFLHSIADLLDEPGSLFSEEKSVH
jgi:TRAP-type mannitol/chloroaromatic compound transport system permease small subunit